jgi:hypothetical protein
LVHLSTPKPIGHHFQFIHHFIYLFLIHSFVMPVAKNTSLFDDKTMEIHQLTHVIKQVLPLPSSPSPSSSSLYFYFHFEISFSLLDASRLTARRSACVPRVLCVSCCVVLCRVSCIVCERVQDITTLNTQIEALQNYVKTQKTLRKNKQTETHALGVVGSLKSELANTTKRFQKVLETRTEVRPRVVRVSCAVCAVSVCGVCGVKLVEVEDAVA